LHGYLVVIVKNGVPGYGDEDLLLFQRKLPGLVVKQ
jgi:hypothetical protein